MEDENKPRLTDIHRPKSSEVDNERLKFDLSPRLPDEGSPLGAAKRRVFPKGIIWGIFLLIIVFVVSLFFSFRSTSEKASDSLARSLDQFRGGIVDLRNLEAQSAEQKFSEASVDIGATLESIAGSLGPLFGGAGDILLGFQNLAGQGILLAQEISFLENNLLTLFLNQGGAELLTRLKSIQKSLADIGNQSEVIVSDLAKLSAATPLAEELYLPLRLDLSRFQKFLDALIVWLEVDSPRRLIVMFQNPSEMRPAGGFLGSYAIVAIKNASLESINVHDINDVDKQLELNIVPPRPLQAIATAWGAAGANWFFDFSKSAAKVAELMEASKLYGDVGTKFDGVIAISPKVVSDILALTGPLELESEEITLEEDGFLVEIQKRVQDGRAKRVTYPKNILRDATPILLSRLSSFDEEERGQFFDLSADWINEKDVTVYFKEPDLESFADYYGVSGRVYELPANFEGDYLAIVDANIGGGKSDLFVRQNVTLTSQIGVDGVVSNHLVIDRDHQGNKSKYWWYKVTNQDYLQIFVPRGSQLTNFKGGFEKKISAPVDYSAKGYSVDPDVAEMESTTEKLFNYPAVTSHEESGKKVFATWSRVKSGRKTQLIFDYTHRLFLPPDEGTAYTFIFEKQAGTERSYKFEISAPVGFRFRENGLPVFTYESDDPPGRLVLDLTLERI